MKDNIVNLVEKVSYRKNVILIEFNENMNLRQQDKEHSYLNFENYGFEIGRKINPFPKKTKFKEIKFGFSVRFTLPSFFMQNIYENAILRLGYIGTKKVFYIESADGDIPDVCSTIYLEKEIEELDLKNGSIEILSKNALKYSYNGENRFEKIVLNDFCMIKQGESYYPSSIKELNSKEFILFFSSPILNQIDDSMFLKVSNRPITKDMYGFKIKENAEISILNLISTTITSFDFSNYQNRIAYLKLRFSKPIKFFDPTDFMIKYNNNSPQFIGYLDVNNDRTIFDIFVSNLDIDNVDTAIFEIFTSVATEEINTRDDEEKIVFVKSKYTLNLFKTSNVKLYLKDYNFSKSIINVEFNSNLLPSSLINDYSIFEENVTSWTSDELTIKSGCVDIKYNTQTNEDKAIITLKNNESFGSIVLKYKSTFKAIITNMVNSRPCKIYIENNCLSLEFDEQEDMDAILVFIDKIEYIPSAFVQNIGKNFIFHGISSIGNYVLDNATYIEPLNNELDNPFKGESLNKNYILALHDSKDSKIYGDNLNLTEINGFLRFVGRLQGEPIVNIKNLRVLGTIIIDASKSSVNLENVECLGNAEIKTR